MIRSRRKTIALIVTREGQLVVRAPLHASQVQINQLITEHADWIRKKMAQNQQRSRQKVAHCFEAGESFLFLGRDYPLVLEEANRLALELRQETGQKECFVLGRSAAPQAARVFETWYRAQARQIFDQRVTLYAARLGFFPKRLRLSSARTRWGSCSSTGTLSLTWRLVMAPLEVIDYVVVHELVHLKVPNHSKVFWARVGEIMPDYAARRAWLKKNGWRLQIDSPQ